MDRIDSSETRAFHKLMEPLFGMQALQWTVTLASYEAFARLVVESRQSLKALDLVPRPLNFTSPYKWASKAKRQSLIDFFESVEGRSHLHRMKGTALKMRSAFEKARTAPY